MCKDANNTVLSVGDAVMYIDNNGGEFEGTIIALLENNKIKIDCETGLMIVDEALAFILPQRRTHHDCRRTGSSKNFSLHKLLMR